jgi:hypothetical protein
VIRNLDGDMVDMNSFRSRRLLNQLRPDVEPWRRDSGTRRRVVLGFYAVLLLAVAGAVGAVIVSAMSSRSVPLSDRLAETGDWLAGGTLALAAIAGLVALQAYASATGLPSLDVLCHFERLKTEEKSNESLPDRILSGPFTINIRLRNDSGYSARNPAVAVEVFGADFSAETPAIGEGWTIPSGDLKAFTRVQWDGGPVYSIHGYWVRRLRLTVGHVRYYESVSRPKIVINVLAEGYRKQVSVLMPVAEQFAKQTIGTRMIIYSDLD